MGDDPSRLGDRDPLKTYRHIKGAIHEIGESFMSLSNFVILGFVFEDVRRLVMKPPHRLAINFSTREISPAGDFPMRLPVAVLDYHETLPQRLSKHGVDPNAVENVALLHTFEDGTHRTRMLAWDDRGKKHSIDVKLPWTD